jgi:hypothetical protein
MSNSTFTRREVVAAAGTAAALATVPGRASVMFSAPDPLLLLDGTLSAADLATASNVFSRLKPRILRTDLVWEWREDLGAMFAQGGRAIAITRWDKALLLNGLARETRLAVRQTRIGPNGFRTDIG